MRLGAAVLLVALVAASAHGGDMGVDTHTAVSPDSTYVVRLKDVPIPEIPEVVIEPRRGMGYAERLAIMADMGVPIAAKMRETQSAPDARRQCLWVGGRVEPIDGDLHGKLVWPSDQKLCATFEDGTRICADSIFVLPTGDALAQLEPIRIWPRRSGWSSSFASIEVKHIMGDITRTRCHVFVAFRAGEFVRRKIEWTECTGVTLFREEDQAAAQAE